MMFGVGFSMRDVPNTYNLSQEDFNDLRDKMIDSAVDGVQSVVRNIFELVFLALYDYDYKTLEVDLSKQILLKGKVELSKEERRHMLSFLTWYMLECKERDLVCDILKQLSKYNNKDKEPEDFFEREHFIPSVW